MAPEAAGALLYRLVLHRTPDGRSHGDFLLLEPGRDTLRTYEISLQDLRVLWKGRAGQRRVSAAAGADLLVTSEAHPDCIVARAKAAHRIQYWEYEGPIPKGRGRIRELIRGQLYGPASETVLFLRWI